MAGNESNCVRGVEMPSPSSPDALPHFLPERPLAVRTLVELASHQAMCGAVHSALDIENLRSNRGIAAESRYDWLTEAEFVCRIRAAIPACGIDTELVRVCAQGRKSKGATNHDIEIGDPVSIAIEAVYCGAARSPVPGNTLAGDLEALLSNSIQTFHVVAFLPRMMPGYRVQKNPTPYDLDDKPLKLPDGTYLFTDCLQAGGLSADSRILTRDIFEEFTPGRGAAQRWTLVQIVRPQTTTINVRENVIQRTVVVDPSEFLWSIVWSHEKTCSRKHD